MCPVEFNDLGWPSLPKLLPVFFHWFEANYFRKYATDLREIFRIDRLLGLDNCCEIGLRSLMGRCHGNKFSFIQSTQFFRQWPMCNKLCALIHDALDRRHEVDRGDFCWQHNEHSYTAERTLPLSNGYFPTGHSPLGHFPETRARRDTTRSASAALNAGIN